MSHRFLPLFEIKDIGEEQSAFDKIKELERLKYSFCPEEFMTRASAFNMREQIYTVAHRDRAYTRLLTSAEFIRRFFQ